MTFRLAVGISFGFGFRRLVRGPAELFSSVRLVRSAAGPFFSVQFRSYRTGFGNAVFRPDFFFQPADQYALGFVALRLRSSTTSPARMNTMPTIVAAKMTTHCCPVWGSLLSGVSVISSEVLLSGLSGVLGLLGAGGKVLEGGFTVIAGYG